MPDLHPWKSSTPFPVHKSWERQWASDLKEPALRKAIWGDTRFARRIIASLGTVSETALPPPPRRKAQVIEKLIRSASGKDLFRRIGLGWLAPSLASKLLHVRTRQAFGTLSSDEMRLVLETRDHASPDLVGPLGASLDPQGQGRACVQAWLATLPDAYAGRVALLLPRIEDAPRPEPQNCRVARARLVNRLFAEDAS